MSAKPKGDISQEERQAELIEFVSLANAAKGLQDIRDELVEKQTINRPLAAAIESYSVGTLGERYPVASFTAAPSTINLTVAQEAVAERVTEILKKLFEMFIEACEKIVEIVKSLYERITNRKADAAKQQAENDAYRKANSAMLQTVSEEDKKDIRQKADEVNAEITEVISGNYSRLFHEFLTGGDVVSAQKELSVLAKPYMDYVSKRMHQFIDLAYQISRIRGEEQLGRVADSLKTLANEQFEKGDRFIELCKSMQEQPSELTFAQALGVYRSVLKSHKAEKVEDAPSYSDFAKARLSELHFEDSLDISRLLADISGLSKKVSNVRVQGDDVSNELITEYSKVGALIKKESHSIVDLINITSDIMGIRLIAIRLDSRKAKSMFSIIREKVADDVKTKADEMVKSQTVVPQE